MELLVLGTSGISPDSIISFKAGSTRRQATVSALNGPLRFPCKPEDAGIVKVDVLSVAGSARSPLCQKGPSEFQLHLKDSGFMAPRSSPGMDVSFQVRPAPSALASPDAVKGSPALVSPEKESLADRYLAQHNILPLMRSIVHGLIKEQPRDPFTFIAQHLALCAGHEVVPPSGKPVAASKPASQNLEKAQPAEPVSWFVRPSVATWLAPVAHTTQREAPTMPSFDDPAAIQAAETQLSDAESSWFWRPSVATWLGQSPPPPLRRLEVLPPSDKLVAIARAPLRGDKAQPAEPVSWFVRPSVATWLAPVAHTTQREAAPAPIMPSLDDPAAIQTTDAQPSKPESSWFLRPSVATWLVQSPLPPLRKLEAVEPATLMPECSLEAHLAKPPARWFVRPSVATWLGQWPSRPRVASNRKEVAPPSAYTVPSDRDGAVEPSRGVGREWSTSEQHTRRDDFRSASSSCWSSMHVAHDSAAKLPPSLKHQGCSSDANIAEPPARNTFIWQPSVATWLSNRSGFQMLEGKTTTPEFIASGTMKSDVHSVSPEHSAALHGCFLDDGTPSNTPAMEGSGAHSSAAASGSDLRRQARETFSKSAVGGQLAGALAVSRCEIQSKEGRASTEKQSQQEDLTQIVTEIATSVVLRNIEPMVGRLAAIEQACAGTATRPARLAHMSTEEFRKARTQEQAAEVDQAENVRGVQTEAEVEAEEEMEEQDSPEEIALLQQQVCATFRHGMRSGSLFKALVTAKMDDAQNPPDDDAIRILCGSLHETYIDKDASEAVVQEGPPSSDELELYAQDMSKELISEFGSEVIKELCVQGSELVQIQASSPMATDNVRGDFRSIPLASWAVLHRGFLKQPKAAKKIGTDHLVPTEFEAEIRDGLPLQGPRDRDGAARITQSQSLAGKLSVRRDDVQKARTGLVGLKAMATDNARLTAEVKTMQALIEHANVKNTEMKEKAKVPDLKLDVASGRHCTLPEIGAHRSSASAAHSNWSNRSSGDVAFSSKRNGTSGSVRTTADASDGFQTSQAVASRLPLLR